jgi:hypothetical protein
MNPATPPEGILKPCTVRSGGGSFATGFALGFTVLGVLFFTVCLQQVFFIG